MRDTHRAACGSAVYAGCGRQIRPHASASQLGERSRPESDAKRDQARDRGTRQDGTAALLSQLHGVRPGFRRPCGRLRQFADQLRSAAALRAEEEDKSPDFSKEKPQTHIEEAPAAAPFDRAAWEGEIKRLSGAFRKYPEVYFATVMIQIQRSNSRMVSSEGSAIVSPNASTRLIMEAQTRAEDGMDLLRVETFQAPTASGLPSETELTGKIEKMAADLSALRKAPVAEPYDGPAVLSGRAAAVFFH